MITDTAVKKVTELPDLPSLSVDWRHSIFSYICWLPADSPAP